MLSNVVLTRVTRECMRGYHPLKTAKTSGHYSDVTGGSMQRIIWNRALSLTLVCGGIAAVACSEDSNTAGPIPQAAKQSGSGGSGSDTSSPPPPRSTGAVASVRVIPQQATVAVGNYVVISAIALDASGARVSNKQPTWRSGDANIVIASDSGIMYGKALGTTKVYATVDGHSDSATVTVVSAPPVQAPPPGVASFDLRTIIVGTVDGVDTSKTAPVAGALVTLTRIGSVTGDTLNPSIDAGSATTDVNGAVSFKALAGGAYKVNITPPSGSLFGPAQTGFAPPRTDAVQLQFKLFKKSP
jgi:hypothetical protein